MIVCSCVCVVAVVGGGGGVSDPRQAAAHAAEWPVADELLALLGAVLRRTAAPRDENASVAGAWIIRFSRVQ